MNTRNQMKAHFEQLDSYLSMLDFYFNNAQLLYGEAVDGMASNNRIGNLTSEFYQHKFILAFFLMRHSLELGFKALLNKDNTNVKMSHDLDKLWEKITNYPEISQILVDEVQQAKNILTKYYLWNDAQIIRYHIDKNGNMTKNFPAIDLADFEPLIGLITTVRHINLEYIHREKFPDQFSDLGKSHE